MQKEIYLLPMGPILAFALSSLDDAVSQILAPAFRNERQLFEAALKTS